MVVGVGLLSVIVLVVFFEIHVFIASNDWESSIEQNA